jgi:hypothetical protein
MESAKAALTDSEEEGHSLRELGTAQLRDEVAKRQAAVMGALRGGADVQAARRRYTRAKRALSAQLTVAAMEPAQDFAAGGFLR